MSTRFLYDMCKEVDRKWHTRTVQILKITQYIGGLGLTMHIWHRGVPFLCVLCRLGCPDGSARALVGLSEESQSAGPRDAWTASNLVALKHTHKELLWESNLVKGVHNQCRILLLNNLASQHVSEGEEAYKLPPQCRITLQVMSHWEHRREHHHAC